MSESEDAPPADAPRPEVPPAEPFVLTYEALVSWCERYEYAFQVNDELQQIAIRYELRERSTPLMIIPQWENGMMIFAMRQPYFVPVDRITPVLIAANRLNSMSHMGAWSLNNESRELIFRVGLAVQDIRYTDTGLLAVARAVVGNSEAATTTLHAIAIEGADVETALAALIKD